MTSSKETKVGSFFFTFFKQKSTMSTTTNKDATTPTTATDKDAQKKKKKPKTVIIKYYEERDNYAKVIPRSFGYVVKARHVAQFNAAKQNSKNVTVVAPLEDEDLKERVSKLTEITGREIIDFIKNDDKWLQKHDPITQVLQYIEETNKFAQITESSIFPLNHVERENILTFHIKRTLALDKVSLLVQSTVTFSDCKQAESWVSSMYSNPQMSIDDLTCPIAIRYFDIYHHGYTRLYKGQIVPVERTGKTIVRLMIEKRKSEHDVAEQLKQLHVASSTTTTTQNLSGLDFYDFIDDENEDEGKEDDFEIVEANDDDEFVIVDDKEMEAYVLFTLFLTFNHVD